MTSMPEGDKISFSDAGRGRSREVVLTEEIFRAYRDARNSKKWPERTIDSDKFYNGHQWLAGDIDAVVKRGESPFVQNETKRIIDGKISKLTANSPKFATTPREDADVGMSRVASMLMDWHWQQSGGNLQLDRGLHHWSHRGGVAWLFSWYDPQADAGRGEVFTKVIEDPLDVYCDPNSKDVLARDAQHLIVKRVLTEKQCLEFWPRQKGRITSAIHLQPGENVENSTEYAYRDRAGDTSGPPLGQQSDDQYHKRYLILERYTPIRVPYVRIFHEGEEKIFSEEEVSAFWQGVAYVIDDGEEQQAAILGEAHDEARQTYEHFGGQGQPITFHLEPTEDGDAVPVAGDETADSVPDSTVIISPIPRNELRDQVIEVPYSERRYRRVTSIGPVGISLQLDNTILPYDQFVLTPVFNGFNGNPFPTDDVDQVRELQQQINFKNQKINKHLATSAGPKVFAPIGAFNQDPTAEDKIASPGMEVIYYDSNQGELKFWEPQALAAELYLSVERDIKSMERILSTYEFQFGDSSSAHQTAAGTLALDQFANRRSGGDLRKIESALSWHGQLVMQMYQRHITSEKVIRLVNPSIGQDETVYINYDDLSREAHRINDITVGKYDVKVVAGSTLPDNRFALADFYIQLFQLGAIDQEELLKKLEVFDVEALLARSSERAQLRQAVEQLQEEVKRLQGDMQTADRELRVADRRVSGEKFKSRLDQIENKAEADRQLAAARFGDAIKEQKQRLSQNGSTSGKSSNRE